MSASINKFVRISSWYVFIYTTQNSWQITKKSTLQLLKVLNKILDVLEDVSVVTLLTTSLLYYVVHFKLVHQKFIKNEHDTGTNYDFEW